MTKDIYLKARGLFEQYDYIYNIQCKLNAFIQGGYSEAVLKLEQGGNALELRCKEPFLSALLAMLQGKSQSNLATIQDEIAKL